MFQELAQSHDSLPVDFDELLGRCLGNQSLMRRLVDNFLKQIDKDLEDLLMAIERQDATEVARLVHKIRGTSLSVSAVGLARAAELLESSLGTVDIAELLHIAAKLTNERLRIGDFLSCNYTVNNDA